MSPRQILSKTQTHHTPGGNKASTVVGHPIYSKASSATELFLSSLYRSRIMSLAFLFKKTWHPSTLQNSERVWVAEQKDAAEKRRIEELTKQVREEQQVRELEEMQVRTFFSSSLRLYAWVMGSCGFDGIVCCCIAVCFCLSSTEVVLDRQKDHQVETETYLHSHRVTQQDSTKFIP